MKPFLHQVASVFFREYGTKISRLAFVFPNRRAGLFFCKYLSEIAGKALFAPRILTINDLLTNMSGKQPADRIGMLFRLYHIYSEISRSEETFDEFVYWGEMLLGDFDDVDKYMVNAKMLFTNVTDLRALDDGFDFLSPEQIAAVRMFWSSFNPKGDAPNQQRFLALWEVLYQLYTRLRDELAAEGQAYEGMIFREVAERIKAGETFDLPYDKIVFVGLNALSVAEECILNELQKQGKADFYWDYASSMVTDESNKASFFALKNITRYPSAYTIEEEAPNEQHIEVIGIPSSIGQAKQVCDILSSFGIGEMDAEKALQTAVVLPDERMLVPVLNSIPEEINAINITMGYPLAGTPIATLMDSVLMLQKNVRYSNGQASFYFRDVLPVLNHQYIYTAYPAEVANLQKEIIKNNRVYIRYDELAKAPLLELLFASVADADGFSDYLIKVLTALAPIIASVKESDDDEAPMSMTDLEQEFIYHYFATVNRMKEMIEATPVSMNIETYFRLIKRVTDLITIPFYGEPLSGLQIMGVLETRALDFDRLVILSMNEGIFPQKKAPNSFIPYNLRHGFGLPTYEHQDSVWAYHFYRLLHRARHVILLYDTRSGGGLQTGEISRYVHQLNYHYRKPIDNKLVVYNVSSSKTAPIVVQKTDAVMGKLSEYYQGGTRALSASAINTYLDCPLKFYFSVVESVQEEDEVSETIESSMFGSIIHKVMETLYEPLRDKMVTADLIKIIRDDNKLLTTTITKAFATEFFKSEPRPLTGQNYLIGEMIRKYVRQILKRDSKLTPFRYIQSEKRIKIDFALNDGTMIALKGFIDRMDEVQGTVRIVDYKSGNGISAFNTIESLFNEEEKDRPKAIMQVFFYSMMYQKEQESNVAIQPNIYYMRTLFNDTFDAGTYHRIERGKKEIVADYNEYAAEFEDALRSCLSNIFDPDTPFTQTTTGKACTYCPFTNLCGK